MIKFLIKIIYMFDKDKKKLRRFLKEILFCVKFLIGILIIK